ncbi:MAG: hypothetical protein K5770_01520 [Lachnospiraceae bacterium]|nr:hypothetical protein [Lachnospiraceae bacterium]
MPEDKNKVNPDGTIVKNRSAEISALSEEDFVLVRQEKTESLFADHTQLQGQTAHTEMTESKLMKEVPAVMPLKLTVDDIASVHKEVGMNFTSNSVKRKKLLSLTQQQRKQQIKLDTLKQQRMLEAKQLQAEPEAARKILAGKKDAADPSEKPDEAKKTSRADKPDETGKPAKLNKDSVPVKAEVSEKPGEAEITFGKKESADGQSSMTQVETAAKAQEAIVSAKQTSSAPTALSEEQESVIKKTVKKQVREQIYRQIISYQNLNFLQFSKKGETPFDALLNNYTEIKKIISHIPDFEEELRIRKSKNKQEDTEELDKAEARLRTLKDIETHFTCIEELMQNKYYAYLSMEEMKTLSTKELRSRYADLFRLPKQSGLKDVKPAPGQKFRNEELAGFYENLIRLREAGFTEQTTAKEKEALHLSEVKKERALTASSPQKKEEQKPKDKKYYLGELKRAAEAYSDLEVFLSDEYTVVSKEQYMRQFLETFRPEECLARFRDKNGTDKDLPGSVKKFLQKITPEAGSAEAKEKKAGTAGTDAKVRKDKAADTDAGAKAADADDAEAKTVSDTAAETKTAGTADTETKAAGAAAVSVSKLTDEQKELVHTAGTYLMERSLTESKRGAYIKNLKIYNPTVGFIPGTALAAPVSAAQMMPASIPLRSEWKSHVPFVFNMLKNSPDQLLIAYYLLENDRQDDATGIDFLSVRKNYQPDLEKIRKVTDWAKISRAVRSSSQISSWLMEYDAREDAIKKLATAPQTVTQAQEVSKDASAKQEVKSVQPVSKEASTGATDDDTEPQDDTEQIVKKETTAEPPADAEESQDIAKQEVKSVQPVITESVATVSTMDPVDLPVDVVMPAKPLVQAPPEVMAQSRIDAETISGMNQIYKPQKDNNCYCCAGTAMVNQFIAKRKKAEGSGDGTITEFCGQDDMRAYRPAVRTFDSLKSLMSQDSYDETIRDLDKYAGENKAEVGNIFEMGDFILDKLHAQGMDNVMLHNISFSFPLDQAKFEEMKQQFIDKVKELLASDHVVGWLRNGHYVTITGIDETKKEPVFKVYNSSNADIPAVIEERKINTFLAKDMTMELDWISEREQLPENLTDTFPGLQYDQGTSLFSVNRSMVNGLSIERMNHFLPSHTRGVTVSRTISQSVDQASEQNSGNAPEQSSQKKQTGGTIIESVYIPQHEENPSVISLDDCMPGVNQRRILMDRGVELNLSAIEQKVMLIRMLYQSAGLHEDMPVGMVEDPDLRKRISDEFLELSKLNAAWRKELKEKDNESSELDLDHHVKKGRSALEVTNSITSDTKEYIANMAVGGTLKAIGTGGGFVGFAGTETYVETAGILTGGISLVGLTSDIVSTISLANAKGLTGPDILARATSLFGSYVKDIGGGFSATGSIIAANNMSTATSVGSSAVTWLKDSSKSLITNPTTGAWATITGGSLAVIAGAAIATSAAVELGREESSKKDVKAALEMLDGRNAATAKAEKAEKKTGKDGPGSPAEAKAEKEDENPGESGSEGTVETKAEKSDEIRPDSSSAEQEEKNKKTAAKPDASGSGITVEAKAEKTTERADEKTDKKVSAEADKTALATKRLTHKQQEEQKAFRNYLSIQTDEIDRKELGSAVKLGNGVLTSVAGGLAMTGFLAPIGALLGVTALFISTGTKICDWIQKNENRNVAVDKYLGLEKIEGQLKKMPKGTVMDENEYRIRIRDVALAERGFSSVKECFRQICFEYATLLYNKVFIENPPPEDIEMYRKGMQALGMKMNDRAATANGENPVPSIEAMVTRMMS